MASDESVIKQELQELQKKLGKKQQFEEAVASIASILRERYLGSSPSLRNSIYQSICRVASILRARYTAPGFWHAGLKLFEEADRIVTEKAAKENLRNFIATAREHLQEKENGAEINQRPDTRYLFEGHLTVQPEPPPPAWLVAQHAMLGIQNLRSDGEPSRSGNREFGDDQDEVMRTLEIIRGLNDDVDLQSVIDATFQDVDSAPKKPPASKDVVATLPILELNEDLIAKLGRETECAVCRENLVIGDKMQELPCKHLFHPPCLKPWLDEHNSCPVCRYELRTDDHVYESWKEREKEAEEERRGAANAVRGGEFMYI
ncbi:hypothetical protein LUZ60_002852 [Juncus effusus]|nr:hypothetical protein LUZ60_002852 [Juncus effusus]